MGGGLPEPPRRNSSGVCAHHCWARSCSCRAGRGDRWTTGAVFRRAVGAGSSLVTGSVEAHCGAAGDARPGWTAARVSREIERQAGGRLGASLDGTACRSGADRLRAAALPGASRVAPRHGYPGFPAGIGEKKVSAPGPDGITYACWTSVADLAEVAVWDVAQAMLRCREPDGFGHSQRWPSHFRPSEVGSLGCPALNQSWSSGHFPRRLVPVWRGRAPRVSVSFPSISWAMM